MKIRAIGTGAKYCRHPLSPPSWIVSSDGELTLIGAPWTVTPTLQRYGYDTQNLSVITVLSPQYDQICGLVELATFFRKSSKKPALVAPAKLIAEVRQRIESEVGFWLDESFNVKSITKMLIKEDYFSESISFVPNFLSPSVPSYGIRFEEAKVFITGETKLNEDWLYKEMSSDLILHMCSSPGSNTGVAPKIEELQELPVYLQSKIWLYGYEVSAKETEQPFPMMYVPPGAWIFDSGRRDKLLSKERFIRENSKKQL